MGRPSISAEQEPTKVIDPYKLRPTSNRCLLLRRRRLAATMTIDDDDDDVPRQPTPTSATPSVVSPVAISTGTRSADQTPAGRRRRRHHLHLHLHPPIPRPAGRQHSGGSAAPTYYTPRSSPGRSPSLMRMHCLPFANIRIN